MAFPWLAEGFAVGDVRKSPHVESCWRCTLRGSTLGDPLDGEPTGACANTLAGDPALSAPSFTLRGDELYT